MSRIEQFLYRLSPRFVRVKFWGMDDQRLLLPADNMFRYLCESD